MKTVALWNRSWFWEYSDSDSAPPPLKAMNKCKTVANEYSEWMKPIFSIENQCLRLGANKLSRVIMKSYAILWIRLSSLTIASAVFIQHVTTRMAHASDKAVQLSLNTQFFYSSLHTHTHWTYTKYAWNRHSCRDLYSLQLFILRFKSGKSTINLKLSYRNCRKFELTLALYRSWPSLCTEIATLHEMTFVSTISPESC